VSAAVDIGARNIGSPLLWGAFLVGVVVVLVVDLKISSREQTSTFKEALWWSVFWIVLSIGFGFFVWFRYGGEQGLEFFAGYLLEKSLSVDNLFVFVLLFRSFAIPPQHQHRVLFWGVLGAIVLRGTLILAGVALVRTFHWVIAVFGAILVYTAWKILFHKDEEEAEPADSPVVRWVAKKLPMTKTIEGPHFFVRHGETTCATPLLLALVAAETTDLVFALDSIPAVFAVTDDPFLVFSSNICALLGLRALYFVVRGALTRLRYLKPGLAVILIFVGLKMLLYKWVDLPTGTSLLIIAAILVVALLASWLRRVPADDEG
jgi:tellurite resistance protein TerC